MSLHEYFKLFVHALLGSIVIVHAPWNVIVEQLVGMVSQTNKNSVKSFYILGPCIEKQDANFVLPLNTEIEEMEKKGLAIIFNSQGRKQITRLLCNITNQLLPCFHLSILYFLNTIDSN